jgi:hypothetical protein
MWRLLPIPLLILAAPAAAAPAGCRELLRHIPAADVAYRPGVDVRGRPVAPADLYPQPAVPAQGRVFIDITVPLSALRDAARRRYDDSEVYIGQVEIDLASGELWFDGQPLSRPEQSAFIAWCRGDSGRPPPLPAHKPTP